MSDATSLDVGFAAAVFARLQPYRGLHSFGPQDGAFFWGRGQAIADLRERLSGEHRPDDPEASHVVVVLGGSGSGKSSLVRGGLVPSLTGTDKMLDRLGRWYNIYARPATDPVGELCRAVEGLAARLGGDKAAACARRLVGGEGDKPRLDIDGLWRFVDEELPKLEGSQRASAGPPTLLLLLDQFEELFAPAIPEESRAQVIELIARAQRAPAEGLFLTITMRTENLHDCGEYAELADVVNRSAYLLGRMTTEGLRDAI